MLFLLLNKVNNKAIFVSNEIFIYSTNSRLKSKHFNIFNALLIHSYRNVKNNIIDFAVLYAGIF
jgi:hypothetical protein